MRIIAGEFKGRLLEAPSGRTTRPTSARARGALFEILGPALPGARVADLFAGTGALGLEGLSRGASSVDFYESSRAALTVLRRNVDMLGAGPRCRIIATQLPEALVRGTPYDIVLVDPPWREGHELRIARKLATLQRLHRDGVLVIECPRSEPLEAPVWEELGLSLADRRNYGDTELRFYRYPPAMDRATSDVAFSDGAADQGWDPGPSGRG
jgi:16S rRNA (guanine966-N2)-methyltransferase